MSAAYDDSFEENLSKAAEAYFGTCQEIQAHSKSSTARKITSIAGQVSSWRIPMKSGHIPHDYELPPAVRFRRQVWTKKLLETALRLSNHVVKDSLADLFASLSVSSQRGLHIVRIEHADDAGPLA